MAYFVYVGCATSNDNYYDEAVYTTPKFYGVSSNASVRQADRVPEGYTELFWTERGATGRRVTYSGKCVKNRMSNTVELFIHVHGDDNEGLAAYANYATSTIIKSDSNTELEEITPYDPDSEHAFTTGKYQNAYVVGMMGMSHTGGTVPQCGWNSTSRNAYYYWNILHCWSDAWDQQFEGDAITIEWDHFNGWPGLVDPTVINTTIPVIDLGHKNIAIKKADGWHNGKPYVKDSGVWREAQKTYVKVNGVWVEGN